MCDSFFYILEVITNEIKEYFDMLDVKDISKETTKEDELFDYAAVFSYLKLAKNLMMIKIKMILK